MTNKESCVYFTKISSHTKIIFVTISLPLTKRENISLNILVSLVQLHVLKYIHWQVHGVYIHQFYEWGKNLLFGRIRYVETLFIFHILVVCYFGLFLSELVEIRKISTLSGFIGRRRTAIYYIAPTMYEF